MSVNWKERSEQLRLIKLKLYEGRELLPCFWCGFMLYLNVGTIEHLQPRSLGGTDDLANCRIACFKCNKKRGTLPVEEFRSSAWLKKKLEQLSREKQNRSIPENKTDSEIRELAASYLEGLDKNQLIAIIMGLAKQQTLDLFAHRKLRNETG